MTRLEEDGKGVISTDTLEGVQKMTIRSTDSHSGQSGGAQTGGDAWPRRIGVQQWGRGVERSWRADA